MFRIWRHTILIFDPVVSLALAITIVQKVNCWILTVKARVQFQVLLYWISGDTKD